MKVNISLDIKMIELFVQMSQADSEDFIRIGFFPRGEQTSNSKFKFINVMNSRGSFHIFQDIFKFFNEHKDEFMPAVVEEFIKQFGILEE